MGFFNKPVLTDLSPLTMARVARALDRIGWRYRFDDGGDIISYWENGHFVFSLMGSESQTLHIRGAWHGRPGIERLAEANEVVADWNKHAMWPKAFILGPEENIFAVACDQGVFLLAGVSDDQLLHHIAQTVTAALNLYDTLSETFPEEDAEATAKAQADE